MSSPELKQMRTMKENRKDKTFLVKLSQFEYNRIKVKADKYTAGNISEWLRYAAKLEPREEDLIEANHE